MYKEKEQVPEFEDFYVPFGGHLREDNRWVRLAAIIPWEEIEAEYKKCFSKRIGRTAKTVRLALGSLLIKEKLQLTDEETVETIRENHYLQYFLGYESYKDEKPFDPSMMVHFRKRLGPDAIAKINELIAKRYQEQVEAESEKKQNKENQKDDHDHGNRGQLIIDATCVPQDIRHPHDVTLLDEARRKTEKIIDTLYEASELTIKPRTYRKQARIKYLNFIRGRRRTKKEIRRAIRTQLQYIRRNLRTINELQNKVPSTTLSAKQRRDLIVIHEVYRQQVQMYKGKTHSISGKIVSISQPHVRPIARGKAKAAFEFGAKLSASMTEHGMIFIDRLQWEPYNEQEDLPTQIEKYKRRCGRYPESVHADKIYRTRANRAYCEARGIRLSGPPLGRPIKETLENKKIVRQLRKIQRLDEAIRQAIEGGFGYMKRKFGLGTIYEKLRETSETAIMVCVLLTNCEKILRDLFMRFLFLLGFKPHKSYLKVLVY
ncbi:IS5 family transposase [Gracilinema caldarium]|uniref:Transposase, IS5 family, putative n=1 Tax=Gracilinema caldarium (strain ATCC 51460 / DSM 7334 / H1) TaxID=744872 RepID=F8F433_GRAC1|nr:IS5 family transposase [Gracilinema caldarium]AEJ18958.1 transposase, IS5 family, putative [Gracilinema caldarium DSM 7334]AEJ20052.1 transposase, IS5 family, putative [Gracilinema caldarium DSM 7334]